MKKKSLLCASFFVFAFLLRSKEVFSQADTSSITPELNNKVNTTQPSSIPSSVPPVKKTPTDDTLDDPVSSVVIVDNTAATYPVTVPHKRLGISYFSLVFGPGLSKDTLLYSPNQLGKPSMNGLYTTNQFSFKYKILEHLSFDLTIRFNFIFNNSRQLSSYSFFRWETPRIGISGVLLHGADWSLKGAINTDMPGILPIPLTGYQAKKRTALFSPGMFALFTWEPQYSNWSVFSTVEPRLFFYQDVKAVEPEYSSGLIPENKPQIVLAFRPTVNYRLSELLKVTMGISLDYRKQIISGWNPFHASLVSNGTSKAWRLQPIPISAGLTLSFHKALTLYPYISLYPIAAQRINANTGEVPSIWKTAFIGMWVYGGIL